jgi:hypothetical protein
MKNTIKMPSVSRQEPENKIEMSLPDLADCKTIDHVKFKWHIDSLSTLRNSLTLEQYVESEPFYCAGLTWYFQ